MHFKIQTDNLMRLDEGILCYSLLFPDDVSLFLFWAKVVIYESYSVPVRYKNITKFFYIRIIFGCFYFLQCNVAAIKRETSRRHTLEFHAFSVTSMFSELSEEVKNCITIASASVLAYKERNKHACTQC